MSKSVSEQARIHEKLKKHIQHMKDASDSDDDIADELLNGGGEVFFQDVRSVLFCIVSLVEGV